MINTDKREVVRLCPSYDLYLTMSWTRTAHHGISGHLYEMIEYYFILNSAGIRTGILICEDMLKDTFIKSVSTKYEISDHEMTKISNDVFFHSRPTRLYGRNILVVDGNFTRNLIPSGIHMFFKNIFAFRCSPQDTHYNLPWPYDNIKLLQDNRVYNDSDTSISIDYKKKILFSRFKKYNSMSEKRTGMLYITKNCRMMSRDELTACLYENSKQCERFIILTDVSHLIRDWELKVDIEILDLPVTNIFDLFDVYIYTPTKTKTGPFDCSPRFIAECKFYGKEVVYHNIDTEYLAKDTGLFYRRCDIENDFDSICLKDNDSIIEIISDNI